MARTKGAVNKPKNTTNKQKKPSEKEKKASEAVKRWADWSMTNHTTEEIKQQILTNPNDVCFTFLCRYSRIPEDFFDEFMVLSSGLLNPKSPKEDYDKIKKVLFSKLGVTDENLEHPYITIQVPYDKTKKIENWDMVPENIDIKRVNEKIDWFYITAYQSLTKDFVLKYKNHIKWGILEPQNDITIELIKEYKKIYCGNGKQADGENSEVDTEIDSSDFDEEYDFDDLD